MAEQAALHLIANFRSQLSDTIEEVVEDSKLVAGALLPVMLASQLNKIAPGVATVDARAEIRKAGKRVADKKRAMLTKYIKALPHILAQRGVGRPKGSKKPEEKKAKEAAEFSKQVEDAIRALRSPSGVLPIKTAVAKYLGIGGISPEGSNTYLSTFRTKLKRLNLDYKAIAEKVNK